MSKHVHINTPLRIKVGPQTLSLITFEDLYNKCVDDPSIFDEMARNPNDLGNILLRHGLVLPAKCFTQLRELLNDTKLVALAKKYIRAGKPWPGGTLPIWGNIRTLRVRIPCTWPNCPSD